MKSTLALTLRGREKKNAKVKNLSVLPLKPHVRSTFGTRPFEYTIRTLLAHVAGNLNGRSYISQILRSACMSYLRDLGDIIFQQDNA
ncbi:hypothetical protein TNCV_4264351 [Trichonephila clavipes]|nr:hypothetical protein TNCV_4264351 [Trichonephila clavipes]